MGSGWSCQVTGMLCLVLDITRVFLSGSARVAMKHWASLCSHRPGLGSWGTAWDTRVAQHRRAGHVHACTLAGVSTQV